MTCKPNICKRHPLLADVSEKQIFTVNNCVRELLTLFQSCRLVALVEVLQKRKLKHNKRPQSQPHALENITIALDAIQDDGIKLVNIGKPV